LPIEERLRHFKTEAGGIWIHGEPSSTVEPGFRAIICLDAKPVVLPTYLGLPTPTGPHDSLRHSVFLQRTSNPNEMFGRWAEDEAADAAAAEVNSNNANIAAAAATGGGANRQQRSRLTMRIRLDEYLTLLGLVREEWKLLETGLTSAARQLSGLDQPMPIDPLMAYLGFGTLRRLGRYSDSARVVANVTLAGCPANGGPFSNACGHGHQKSVVSRRLV
jgi:hypothetical protein